jgi:hypothetical protein
MAWVIKNASSGTIIITDINLTFGPQQIRDLDIIGRDNAERSTDLKVLLAQRNSPLKEIAKDARQGQLDPKIAQQVNDALLKITDVSQQATQAQTEQNEKISALEQKVAETQQMTRDVLEEIRAMSKKFPLHVNVVGEAMKNISVERKEIAEQRAALADLAESGASESEIAVQDRILAARDKRLEKNCKNLGESISHEGVDLEKSLEALDELGIGN